MYLGSIHQCTCISFIFKKKLKNKFSKKIRKKETGWEAVLNSIAAMVLSSGGLTRTCAFFSIPYCTLLGGLLSPKTPLGGLLVPKLSWEGIYCQNFSTFLGGASSAKTSPLSWEGIYCQIFSTFLGRHLLPHLLHFLGTASIAKSSPLSWEGIYCQIFSPFLGGHL